MARNRLLATAAGVGVVAAVVFLAGTALDFANVVSLPEPSGPFSSGYIAPSLNSPLS